MRKLLTSFLAAAVIFSSTGYIFATVPQDVEETPYQDVVTRLMAKGIVSGYKDDTFQPERTINRAEACIIVVRAMGATDADLDAAADSEFTDMDGYRWAAPYINYAAEYGIVSGYGNDTFMPGEYVTVAEMVVMLIRACGIPNSEIDGRWPIGYMNKARELGMLEGLQPEGGVNAEAEATRGNVALMTAAVSQMIEDTHVVKLAERPVEVTEHRPLTKQEAAAYLAVVEAAQERYGEGELAYVSGNQIHYNMSGVFGIFLIDFDGDGKDELLLAYGNGMSRESYSYDAYTLESGKAERWVSSEASPHYDGRNYTYLLKKNNGTVHLKVDGRYEKYVTLENGSMTVAMDLDGSKGQAPRVNGEVVTEDVFRDLEKGYFDVSRGYYFTTRDSGKVGTYENNLVRSHKVFSGEDILSLTEGTVYYLNEAADGKASKKNDELDIFAS